MYVKASSHRDWCAPGLGTAFGPGQWFSSPLAFLTIVEDPRKLSFKWVISTNIYMRNYLLINLKTEPIVFS